MSETYTSPDASSETHSGPEEVRAGEKGTVVLKEEIARLRGRLEEEEWNAELRTRAARLLALPMREDE